MTITLARHLLTTRQQCFDIAHGNMHVGGVLHVLLHDAGNELALLAAERTEDLVILGMTEQQRDDLTSSGGGETAEILGVSSYSSPSVGAGWGSSVGVPGISSAAHTVNVPARSSSSISACLAACGVFRYARRNASERASSSVSGPNTLLRCELMNSCQVQFHVPQDLPLNYCVLGSYGHS